MRDMWMTVALIIIWMGGCQGQERPVEVTVTVNASVKHQPILGWGKTTPWMSVPRLLRDQCIDRAVNDLGLNRLRFEGMCGNRIKFRSWEWLNDNDDPFNINWEGFNTEQLDMRVREWLVPWKAAVEARDEPFNLYVSPSFFKGGSSGDLPPWMAADPQEYAEWALALLLRLRDEHGITADYYSICNEAGNNNVFTAQVVAQMTRALVPRLREAGFQTLIQFPESVNAHVAWQYIEELRNESQIWDWIGLLSYHWYGRDNQAAMVKVRDFARERGLPTAQTEFMDLTIDHLYDDLVLGGTSYWEIYGLATPDFEAALSHISSTSFRGGPWYWQFRQVIHYVRPGAVRLEATSTDMRLRALAFEAQGKRTVVLINTSVPHMDRTVAVKGLAPGIYGVSQAIGQNPCQELGLREVGADGVTTVTVKGNSVLTVYPREAANRPPTVIEWRSRPDFLTMPASALELICSAVDPELEGLNYEWALVSAPPGAQVILATPNANRTRAEGLTVAGEYLFVATVSDGTHEVKRQVLVKVFESNQPPVPTDVHNRIPVWVTVRDGGTLLRAGAWDIEKDPVTYRWSVRTQPAGAAATLETPDQPACKVTGMTVAGDYVFRLELSDPTHTVSVEHTVPVYP
ncbi:MAG: hypothetical protein ACUVX8_08305 [Candidatus Zipacnadales bacterium]